MPWIIRIGACLEGREKADKCRDGRILDHIWKWKKKARVVLALRWESEWARAQLTVEGGRRQLRGAGHMSSTSNLTAQQADTRSSFLLNLGDGIEPASLSTYLCDLLPPPSPCCFCTAPSQCLSSTLLLPKYLTTHPQRGWPKFVLQMTELSFSFQ